MPENCTVCERRFQPEPGFYYGAMYVSYGLGVALFIGVYLLLALFAPLTPTWLVVTTVLLAMLVLAPLTYALSKIIYANLFFGYKGVERTATEKASRTERLGRTGS